MANKDQPCGFRPYGRILRVGTYTAGGTFYVGDALTMDNAGKVVVAAATNALIGVSASNGSDGVSVGVWDHPDQQFVVQANGTDPASLADINQNADILATAGSSTYKVSRQELDSSTTDTTATLQLKMLGIERAPGNTYGQDVDVVVAINNHALKGGTGTAGL